MKWVPRQKRVGRFIGGLKELLSRVTFYISIMNFGMLIVTSYYTTIRYVFPVPFWAFFGFLAIVVLIAMVLEYVVVLPSQMAFLNWQVYQHDNPIRRDLETIMEKLDELERQLKKDGG